MNENEVNGCVGSLDTKTEQAMDRRRFGGLLATSLIFPALASMACASQGQRTGQPIPAGQVGSGPPGDHPPMHSGRRPEIAMVLYNGMTLLDTIGPMTALNAATQVYLVAETKDPIIADTGNAILPTTTFDECPKDLDVLFVGGGSFLVLKDKAMLRFIADRGARAKYVTSVCSGSIVLGAAGLLKGYEATSHWASRDLLPLFGAKPVDARVVVDRNRMSGGVTAGIDFGLTLLAKLVGEDVAKLSQLAMEYDPAPPFNSGSPKTADPEIVKRAKEWIGAMSVQHAQFVQEVSQAMPK
ncbi:DJ-1/PfpI family protein [Cystobacter fuscus]